MELSPNSLFRRSTTDAPSAEANSPPNKTDEAYEEKVERKKLEMAKSLDDTNIRLLQLESGDGAMIPLDPEHPAYPFIEGRAHRNCCQYPFISGAQTLQIIQLGRHIRNFGLEFPKFLQDYPDGHQDDLPPELAQRLSDLRTGYKYVAQMLRGLVQACLQRGQKQHAEILMSFVENLQRIYFMTTGIRSRILPPGSDPLDVFDTSPDGDAIKAAGKMLLLLSIANDQSLEYHFDMLKEAAINENADATAKARLGIILDILDAPGRIELLEPRAYAAGRQQLADIESAISCLLDPERNGFGQRLQAVGNRGTQGPPLHSPVEPMAADGGPVRRAPATAVRVTPEKEQRLFPVDVSDSNGYSDDSEESDDDDDDDDDSGDELGAIATRAGRLKVEESIEEEEAGYIDAMTPLTQLLRDPRSIQALCDSHADLTSLEVVTTPVVKVTDDESRFKLLHDIVGPEAEGVAREIRALESNVLISPIGEYSQDRAQDALGTGCKATAATDARLSLLHTRLHHLMSDAEDCAGYYGPTPASSPIMANIPVADSSKGKALCLPALNDGESTEPEAENKAEPFTLHPKFVPEKTRLERSVAGGLRNVTAVDNLAGFSEPQSRIDSKPSIGFQIDSEQRTAVKTLEEFGENTRLLKKEMGKEQMGPLKFQPDFPMKSSGQLVDQLVAVDEKEWDDKIKEEILYVRRRAPDLFSHLDYYMIWPGRFKNVRTRMEDQEVLETDMEKAVDDGQPPTKKRRWENLCPSGDNK